MMQIVSFSPNPLQCVASRGASAFLQTNRISRLWVISTVSPLATCSPHAHAGEHEKVRCRFPKGQASPVRATCSWRSGFSLFIDILAGDALRTLMSRSANSKAADQKPPVPQAPPIEAPPPPARASKQSFHGPRFQTLVKTACFSGSRLIM
jgi:hypothetical protein